MRNSKSLQCLLILFVFCLVNSGYNAQSTLNLYEGNICRKGRNTSSDHICRKIKNCPVALQGIRKNIKPQLCSFDEQNLNNPIVCCPPDNKMTVTTTTTPSTTTAVSTPRVKTYSAAEKCHEYSELVYTLKKDPILSNSNNRYIKYKNCTDVKTLIVGGKNAEPREFPHMALLGYHEEINAVNKAWLCGGTLISNRWILTAAHCESLGDNVFARWARLGELNYEELNDSTIHQDYQITQRVVHPNYQRTRRYNDIALFRLGRDVNLSPYVRPICLHTEKFVPTSSVIATGWGQTGSDEEASTNLKKVALNIISVEHCDSVYKTDKQKLPNGVDDRSMICAGVLEGGKDTCNGDSGGPIQIKHPNSSYPCMYSQVGITSFGTIFCGSQNTPAVYTRVSTYIPWIEQTVWPKN